MAGVATVTSAMGLLGEEQRGVVTCLNVGKIFFCTL